jgi:hypothetical protein
MFGSGLVMVILSMVIGLIVVYKMRLPLELSAIGLLGIVTALSYSVLPGYVFWVGIILLSVISGYGFYKWTRR